MIWWWDQEDSWTTSGFVFQVIVCEVTGLSLIILGDAVDLVFEQFLGEANELERHEAAQADRSQKADQDNDDQVEKFLRGSLKWTLFRKA